MSRYSLPRRRHDHASARGRLQISPALVISEAQLAELKTGIRAGLDAVG